MNTALEKIGMWYEKMPSHIREKHFAHLHEKKAYNIVIDGEDEINLFLYLKKISPILNQKYAEDFLQYFSDYAIFKNAGKKIIKVSDPILKEELFNTDIDKMTINDLHLPFNFFFVELGLEYQDLIREGNIITIEGAYIHSLENDILHIVTLEKHSFDGLPSCTYFDIYKDIPIHEQITRIATDIYQFYQRSTNLNGRHRNSLVENDKDLIQQIVKLFSILFFLDFAQQDKKYMVDDNKYKAYEKNNKQESKKKINIKKIKAYHYINLINPTSSHLKESDTNVDQHSYKQTKLAFVRGHWRKQGYGPRNLTQYKNIWIKPFWRNLDAEKDDKLHIYEIK